MVASRSDEGRMPFSVRRSGYLDEDHPQLKRVVPPMLRTGRELEIAALVLRDKKPDDPGRDDHGGLRDSLYPRDHHECHETDRERADIDRRAPPLRRLHPSQAAPQALGKIDALERAA